MFWGLICQWTNITRRKTVRRCIEQVRQITDWILFIIFSALVANSVLANEATSQNDTPPVEQQDINENSDLKIS